MRTTLNIDDDVLEILKSYAEIRSVGLGRAASELMRRGLNAPVETRMVSGFCAVVLPKNAAKVTSEQVKHLHEDEI
jgi:hypothetical protein